MTEVLKMTSQVGKIDFCGIETIALFQFSGVTAVIQADPQEGGLMSDRDLEDVMWIMNISKSVKLTDVEHAQHMQNSEAVILAIKSFVGMESKYACLQGS
jgi:hypothetical protein